MSNEEELFAEAELEDTIEIPEPVETMEEGITEVEGEAEGEAEAPKYSDKEKAAYARMKEAISAMKTLRQENRELKAQLNPTGSDVSRDVLEIVSALDGYGKEEKEIIIDYSKKTGLSVRESLNDQILQMAINQKRREVEHEGKVPKPSVSGGGGFGSKSYKDVENMSAAEHAAFEKEELQKDGGRWSI
ncbi:MAG: hypothetical protein HY764_01915 [Candidatus Portnoybacteria bacterium]|nr:hypothetical protein [Candidatus Portnoybacteria bacterium]